MNTQDLLNILLVACILVFVTCSIFITYFLIQTLKSITNLADNLANITLNIKDKVHLTALAAIPSVLLTLVSKIIRRGR